MKGRPALFIVTLTWLTLSVRAQTGPREPDFWPSTLLENAWGIEKAETYLFSGVEFEEDSGDFPTTKFELSFAYGLSDRLMLTGSGLLVRFNKEDYTAWGGAEPTLGLQYRVLEGEGLRPSLQFKGKLYFPAGGMSATDFAASGGLDMSWRKGSWGLHTHGHYTAGSANEKDLGVSEVDRWRVAAGASYLIRSRNWTWTLAVVGARPIRPKPVEWTLEAGTRLPLSRRVAFNFGAAGGLRERGVDWLYRFGLDFRF